MKQSLILLAAVLLLLTAMSVAPTGTGVAVAQTRHVLVEEFTGSWCGWCPRGAYAMQVLDKKYPGKVFCIAYHNSDPMHTAQGDTLASGRTTTFGTVFPLTEGLKGYPDSWVGRELYDKSNDGYYNAITWN